MESTSDVTGSKTTTATESGEAGITHSSCIKSQVHARIKPGLIRILDGLAARFENKFTLRHFLKKIKRLLNALAAVQI